MADLKQSQFPDIAPLLTDKVAFVSDPAGTPANGLVEFSILQALIGGGAVDSVNGQTGVVLLDPDDLNDSASTNKFTSQAEIDKLAGIEANATADQTGAEIKAAYEAEADTNAFTDAEQTKLAGIEAGATGDQTGAEIKAAYEAEADTNAFTDAEQTKLAGIAAGAEVNPTNVSAFTNDAGYLTTALQNVSEDTTPQLGGELDGQSNKIVNVANPTNPQDVATKDYVDSNEVSGISAVVEDTTPQLGGNLDTQGNEINNLPTPSADGDASNKKYVDDEIQDLFGSGNGTDIDGATHTGNIQSITITAGTTPQDLHMSPDETRIYIVASGTNAGVSQLDLAIPGELGGGTPSPTGFAIAAELGTGLTAGTMSGDGTLFWVTDGNLIATYLLSTPYNVSGMTYQGAPIVNLGSLTGGSNFQSLQVSADGTKMYAQGNGTIYELDFGTPNDRGTLTYSGVNFTPAEPTQNDFGISLSPLNNQILVADGGTDTVYQYDITTALDLTTISYSNKSFALEGTNTNGNNLTHTSSGDKLFTIDAGNEDLYDYNTTALSSAAFLTQLQDDSSPTLGGELNADSNKIVSLGDGTDPADAVNKGQLDAAIAGIPVSGGVSFTLAEDLGSAGTPVAITPAGEVESVTEDTGVITFGTVGAQGTDTNVDIAYSPTQDAYLAVYQRQSDLYPVMRAGTRSGQSIVWGAEVQISSSPFVDLWLTYNPFTDCFLTTIKNSTSQSVGTRIIQIVGGVPTVVATASGFSSSNIMIGEGAAETGGGIIAALVTVSSTNNMSMRLFDTTTPASPSAGSVTTVGAGTASQVSIHGADTVYDAVNDCFWVVYNKAGFGVADAVPAIVKVDFSGTTITGTTETLLPYSGGSPTNSDWSMNIELDPPTGKFVVTLTGVGIIPGGRDTIFAWIVDPGVGTPTASAAQVLFDDGQNNTSRYDQGSDIFYDSTLDKWYFYIHDKVDGISVFIPFSINGTEDGFDVDSRITVNASPTSEFQGGYNACYPSAENGTYVVTEGTASGDFESITYTPGSVSNVGNFIGFLDEAGLTGESKIVNLLGGGVDDNQSGLTFGQTYYVNADGSITDTAASAQSVFAGKAVKADTLMLAAVTE